MEAMTNFYRYLTGAKPLLKKCVQNESLQYQALDRNFQFDHYISNSSKPDDMDDELWQKGFNLDHNILAMYATPFGSITSWMNEGYSLSNGTWDTTCLLYTSTVYNKYWKTIKKAIIAGKIEDDEMY